MKKKEKFRLFHSFKRRFYFFFIRVFRFGSFLISSHKSPKFLFILSPPYCGSTMLNQLISSSKNVSCNNNLGTSNINPYLSKKNTWFQKQSGIILSILFYFKT